MCSAGVVRPLSVATSGTCVAPTARRTPLRTVRILAADGRPAERQGFGYRTVNRSHTTGDSSEKTNPSGAVRRK